MKKSYAFCEWSGAASLAPWHIRRLTEAGKKTGGGVDTASLCGRVQPHSQGGWGGWDLEAEVAGYPMDRETEGRRHVCKTCAEKYSVDDH
jgi:hypothetical protein